MAASQGTDAAQRARWDRAVLAWLRTGAADSARDLRDLSLGLASSQPAQEPWAFWSLCAAFFDTLSQQQPVPDLPLKLLVSRVWLQYVACARGELGVPASLVPALLRQGERYGAFLEQADDWSGRLEAELNQWARQASQPLSPSARQWTQYLAASAFGLQLPALSELAYRLAQALPAAEQAAPAACAQAALLVSAAEHLRQLLHQHAAGVPKPANAQLLDALDALRQAAPLA